MLFFSLRCLCIFLLLLLNWNKLFDIICCTGMWLLLPALVTVIHGKNLFWLVLFQSYAGNLDERVSDRVLYDILIQAGRVVDLYIPRDKETDKPKGFAFAEYETEEIASYAVRLFTGLVTLYNRTLKFAVCPCCLWLALAVTRLVSFLCSIVLFV